MRKVGAWDREQFGRLSRFLLYNRINNHLIMRFLEASHSVQSTYREWPIINRKSPGGEEALGDKNRGHSNEIHCEQ